MDNTDTQALEPFPQKIMYDLYWSFHGEKYQSRRKFDEEVRQYQIEITGIDSWENNEIVLRSPRVRIEYFRLENRFYHEELIAIESDNGEFFTAVELLFKVHNAVVEHLRELNHHFFEGFDLKSIRSQDNLPLYHLCQGS